MLFKKRFENKEGKVVYITVENIRPSGNYPEESLKVEATVYPVGPGSYSSFIYTSETEENIKKVIVEIGNNLLKSDLIGAKEISDLLSKYLNPIFPKKNN